MVAMGPEAVDFPRRTVVVAVVEPAAVRFSHSPRHAEAEAEERVVLQPVSL